MDRDLKKLIDETINKFFENAPEKMVERGVREIYYDICPHCKKEIYEKHDYTDDGGVTWRHSDCHGLINRPEEPLDDVVDWIRPYVEEARKWRHLEREKRGLTNENLPPSGEEKYYKQEPGGTMGTANTTPLIYEKDNLYKLDKIEKMSDLQFKEYIRRETEKYLARIRKKFPVDKGIKEINEDVPQKQESFDLPISQEVNYSNRDLTIFNASKNPLKLDIVEYTIRIDKNTFKKKYFIKVKNG